MRQRGVLILLMRNLFLCRHVENISVRLFSRFFLSAFIVNNFSSRQRLHNFAPLSYPFARFEIDQLTVKSFPSSFNPFNLIKRSRSCIYGREMISYGCCSDV